MVLTDFIYFLVMLSSDYTAKGISGSNTKKKIIKAKWTVATNVELLLPHVKPLLSTIRIPWVCLKQEQIRLWYP